MPDTYPSQSAFAKDKALLARALDDLDVSPTRLRLDECRTWSIQGRYSNSITTYGDGRRYILYLECHSARAWNSAKNRLPFMTVMQDGDLEGTLSFRLPLSADEADTIRSIGGFRRAIALSPEARTALAERLAAARIPKP